jgi:hypothetical protein
MEDPEAYLRALTAPLARAGEGCPLPVVRFSVEAVANAFVVLGLLPAQRAEEILAAQRPVLEAAGFRVGRQTGELSVSPGARVLQEARAADADGLPRIPLAVAAGPVRCRLRGHDLVLTWATLTPEGIRLRYHGDARESDRHGARAAGREIRAAGQEITGEITELAVTDDTGRPYLVPAGHVHGIMSGRRSPSGGTIWHPEGEFLALPAPDHAASRGARPAVQRLELSAGSGPPARVQIPPPGPVPTGTHQPPWPTPAECYLAELAPPAPTGPSAPPRPARRLTRPALRANPRVQRAHRARRTFSSHQRSLSSAELWEIWALRSGPRHHSQTNCVVARS